MTSHRFLEVWRDARLRRRVVATSLLVGIGITLAHRVPQIAPRAWSIVHLALPAVVFGMGARGAGRGLSRTVLGHGLLVVAVVGLSFQLINGSARTPSWARLPLNLLVPALVSTYGAVAARSVGSRGAGNPGGSKRAGNRPAPPRISGTLM